MKLRILESEVKFATWPFRKPLVLSSGAIRSLAEAQVTVRASCGRQEATGYGSILLSDLWAWPRGKFTHEEKDAELKAFCGRIARELGSLCGGEPAHPLELGLRLHASLLRSGGMPELAAALCGSPFDAAIHDAAGRLAGRSALDLYDNPEPVPTADSLFGEAGACEAIRRTLTKARTELEAWWIVCAGDPLEEELAPVIRENGYRCFKIKITGRNIEEDVARTSEVFRVASSSGAAHIRLSVDSNEANSTAAEVLEYLERLQLQDKAAYAALLYLEQPTDRAISTASFDWRKVGRLKPVMLDEGLTGFDVFPLVLDQGWRGLALKTCKGHSFALVAAAWAAAKGLLISVQDLTNPGIAAIHAGLLAARLPTINGVELNSPQYIPAANERWLPRLADFFQPRGGVHRLHGLEQIGLGSGS